MNFFSLNSWPLMDTTTHMQKKLDYKMKLTAAQA